MERGGKEKKKREYWKGEEKEGKREQHFPALLLPPLSLIFPAGTKKRGKKKREREGKGLCRKKRGGKKKGETNLHFTL